MSRPLADRAWLDRTCCLFVLIFKIPNKKNYGQLIVTKTGSKNTRLSTARPCAVPLRVSNSKPHRYCKNAQTFTQPKGVFTLRVDRLTHCHKNGLQKRKTLDCPNICCAPPVRPIQDCIYMAKTPRLSLNPGAFLHCGLTVSPTPTPATSPERGGELPGMFQATVLGMFSQRLEIDGNPLPKGAVDHVSGGDGDVRRFLP